MGFENGKLVRVTLQAVHSSGSTVVNTLHYDLQDRGASPDANDPQSLADTFRDDVVPAFKALFDSGNTIQPVVVMQEKDPQNPNAPRSAWTSGSAVAGTRAVSGDSLPNATCGVCKLITSSVGRRYTGRIFLGGTLMESDQAGGTWGSGILTLWDAFLTAIPVQPDISAPLSSSTANLCVYSRTQRAANLDPYANHVTAHVRRSKVYWLRSRED